MSAAAVRRTRPRTASRPRVRADRHQEELEARRGPACAEAVDAPAAAAGSAGPRKISENCRRSWPSGLDRRPRVLSVASGRAPAWTDGTPSPRSTNCSPTATGEVGVGEPRQFVHAAMLFPDSPPTTEEPVMIELTRRSLLARGASGARWRRPLAHRWSADASTPRDVYSRSRFWPCGASGSGSTAPAGTGRCGCSRSPTCPRRGRQPARVRPDVPVPARAAPSRAATCSVAQVHADHALPRADRREPSQLLRRGQPDALRHPRRRP